MRFNLRQVTCQARKHEWDPSYYGYIHFLDSDLIRLYQCCYKHHPAVWRWFEVDGSLVVIET